MIKRNMMAIITTNFISLFYSNDMSRLSIVLIYFYQSKELTRLLDPVENSSRHLRRNHHQFAELTLCIQHALRIR